MRRGINKRWIAVLLSLIMLGSNPITALATQTSDEVMEEVPEATSVLVDVDEAHQSLKALAAEREIPALLYLKDIYTIKTKPDRNSNDVASISSGQEVLITGVGEDSGHNIWYQVTYRYDEGELSGYIEREYLAFSDERMIEWEDIHIRSMRMWAMRASSINYADVEQFPESYRNALYKLKQQHPNWKFVKMETGLDWNYVVDLQSEGSRSLIWNKTALDSWKDGTYSSSWAIASDGIIKYYLDPRNALTEKLVFQFEQLTYNKSYHSVSSTQMVLEGTFMDSIVPGTDMYYSDAFMRIAAEKNISPVLMAARVRQEQGTKGSLMISGTYPGFEGLYNHYNVGASGNTQEKELISGLTKAREMGWTTPMLSLTGGSSVLSNNYIRKGQDTLYLQKFDVDSSYNGVCWHQYMQNIAAPENEALSTYKAYSNAGIVDSSFVFKIPVYRNMPSYACTKPGSEEKITLNVSTIENLPVNSTAVLLSYINGSQNNSVAMNYTSSDTGIATVDSNGVVTGISPGEVTITCKRAENASSATTATCKVKVVKADISISDVEIPEIEVTYSSKQTLASIKLPSGFAWVDGTVIPTVQNSGYSVTYNPDNSKYNTLTLTIPVTVNKAVTDKGSLSLPSNLTAVAGDELKSIALPNGYVWDDASQTVPKKVGTYSYGASYCADEVNYEVVEDITLSVKVVCKTHEFGEWTGSHADCMHDGEITRVCTICDAKESVTENAIGHEYVSEITKEPSTFESGIRTYTCTRCDDSYEIEIPVVVGPHTHEYEKEITVEPTCEASGIATYTCDCKDVYTEVIEALGHEMVDGECTRCDYVIQTLPQHTHSYTFAGSTETCTNAGIATYVCGCGESYTEKTKALGHDMDGNKCTRCDYTEEIPDDEDKNDSGTTKPDSSGGSGNSGSNNGNSGSGSNSGTNGGSTGGSGSNSSNSGSTGSGSDDSNSGSSGSGSDGSNSGNGGSGNSSSNSGSSGSGSDASNSGSSGSGNNGSNSGSAGGNGGSGNSSSNSGSSGSGNNSSNNENSGNGNSGSESSSGNSGSGSSSSNSSSNSTSVNKNESKDENKSEDKTTTESSDKKSDKSEEAKDDKTVLEVIQDIFTPNTSEQKQEQSSAQANAQTNTQSSPSQSEEKTSSTQGDESAETKDSENEEAVEQTANALKITMKHSTMLNKDKLAIVNENNSSLELVMADNVAWKIDLSNVEDVNSINVDMGVKLNEADIPENVLAALPKDSPIILMSLAHDGPFEFGAVLEVPVNKLNAGKYANLFYYNPDTAEMEFIAASVVSEDGMAEFVMDHASDYAIVLAEQSLDPNPPVEEEPIENEKPAISEDNSAIVSSIGVVVLVIIIAVLAVVGIVFGVRFFKKKSEDAYYFDEEDELPEE